MKIIPDLIKLKLGVILPLFLLSGINGYCQDDKDIFVIEYANDKRPMFDGDMSFMKLDKQRLFV